MHRWKSQFNVFWGIEFTWPWPKIYQKIVFLNMDIQLIAVIVLFALALLYVGNLAYKGMKSKAGCASNCGKCAADFSQVMPQKKNK